MPDPKELRLRFKAPEDVKVPEVAVLTKSISKLFEKLESKSRSRQLPRATRAEVNPLERKLVIKEVKYGSDLILILLTAANVALAIPNFIIASRQLKEREMQRVARERLENKEAAERSFRRLMKEEGDDVKSAVAKLAAQLQMSTEDLLELVGPEMEAFYESKIAFAAEDLPYK